MSSIVQGIVTAILNWLTGIFTKSAQAANEKVADEKINAEIEREEEDAQTLEEVQAALNRSATRTGRDR